MSNSNEQASEVIKLKQFYVYVLIDPRDNEVFYVGKGQGERAFQHERDVISQINKLSADEVTEFKHNKEERIKDILSCSREVSSFVIGRYNTEVESLAVESTLIKWVYGFDELTNKVHGHGHDSIRAKDDYSELPCIDVPEPIRSNDGSFTEANRNGIVEHKIEEKLNILISLIQESDLACKNHVGTALLHQPKEPCFFIQYNEYIGIQCIVFPSGTDRLVTSIKVMPNANDHKLSDNYLGALARNTGLVAKGVFRRRYVKKDDWKARIHINAQQQILGRISDIWAFLTKNDPTKLIG